MAGNTYYCHEVRAMTMIIVGVDGSEQSRRALVWAVKHAIARSAAVQAITAVDTKNLGTAQRAARLAEAETMLAEMVTQVLDSCTRPPTVTYEVVEGDPSIVMVDASQRADLIVFGSHRMTSIRQTALGTVSTACIRLGGCPVLVIPVDLPEPMLCGDLVPA